MLPVSCCDATKEERLPKIKLCIVNKNERHLSLCFAVLRCFKHFSGESDENPKTICNLWLYVNLQLKQKQVAAYIYKQEMQEGFMLPKRTLGHLTSRAQFF